VAAAFFPAAVAVMLWLLATPPRVRRGVVYLAGAATSTVGSGIVSFAYVVAIDLIVNSGLSVPTQIINLLVVDVIVLAPIEAPLLLYGLVPGPVIVVVTKIDALVRRYFWQLGTLTAGAGGTYLVVRGWLQLSH
jgi:hypothetical protein